MSDDKPRVTTPRGRAFWAQRPTRFVHVAKRVGVIQDPKTGLDVPITERKGRTYRKPRADK